MATSQYQEAKARASIMEDAARVRRALKELDPALVRALDKANREAAKPTIQAAQRFVEEVPYPLYGWVHKGRTGWDAAAIRRGFKFRAGKSKRGQVFRNLLEFSNTNAAGAIFEVTGRKSAGRNRPDFVTKLNNAYPRKSRLLWRAVDETGMEVLQSEISQNYEIVRRQVQSKIGGGI